MPFALIIIGVVLVVASVRNTQGDLYTLVKGDFTGQNNYVYWMLSILLVGSLGYIPSLTKLSRVFLVLILVVLLLHKQGFFTMFQQQISASLPNASGSGSTPDSTTQAPAILLN
jgi:putative exporter of polyketide antibiotics